MSSDSDLKNILQMTSEELIKRGDYVKKCDSIRTEIEEFAAYKKHSKTQLADLVRSAEYYRKRARDYFGFFGIDFENFDKSKVMEEIPHLEPKYLMDFIFCSVKFLYVNLWELLSKFLKPLQEQYYLTIIESGLFPKDFPLFLPIAKEEEYKLDLYQMMEKEPIFFRVDQNFPFELSLMYKASSERFGQYVREGLGNLGIKLECSDCLEDLIRLYILRNNICHIGRQISMQEDSEERAPKLIYRLSTHLPRMQTSCLGLMEIFKVMTAKQAGTAKCSI